jgi:hypothetical protein
MSVRERILLHSPDEPAVLAQAVAAILGAHIEENTSMVEMLMPMEAIRSGTQGEFGGPVLRRDPEWPYRPPDEWEAVDAYELEWRLWQAYGPQVDAETGEGLELAAASTVFERLASGIRIPMPQLHLTDKLIAAYHPDHGLKRYPRLRRRAVSFPARATPPACDGAAAWCPSRCVNCWLVCPSVMATRTMTVFRSTRRTEPCPTDLRLSASAALPASWTR